MIKLLGKRGFVTIATGNVRYYKLAVNLLKSYHLNAKCSLPFAIIADQENAFTSQFDYTIVISNPTNSYMDKLRLYEMVPFEETIFIDADSLIYDDLNEWWNRFSEADDFSVFGVFHEKDSDCGWFRTDGMKEFKNQIPFVPMFNGGVYYLRKTEKCRKVFELAQHCARNYHNYSFCGIVDPADEPVIALGMAVCGCKPIKNENGFQAEYVFAPDRKKLEANIITPAAYYHRKDKTVRTRLIHWSNYLTEKSDYRYEIYRIDNNGHSEGALPKFIFRIYDIRAFYLRLYRGLKRKLK